MHISFIIFNVVVLVVVIVAAFHIGAAIGRGKKRESAESHPRDNDRSIRSSDRSVYGTRRKIYDGRRYRDLHPL